MLEIAFTDIVGIAGASLIVLAYFALQIGHLQSHSLSFSIANSAGAAGIIFSLLNEFNLSAFVIESFWLIISLYGVFRALRLRKTPINQQ